MKLKLVHLGKNFQNECSFFIQTGKKSHKTLWYSGACKCVISLESYQTDFLTDTKLNCFQAVSGSRQQMAR